MVIFVPGHSTPTRANSNTPECDRSPSMAKLKPWFHVVTPREDLRENRPLDASEFAVKNDLIRDGKARKDYQDPERFFARTYLTRNLRDLAAQTARRLSGTETGTRLVLTAIRCSGARAN